jgi:replicative DNA helicase
MVSINHNGERKQKRSPSIDMENMLFGKVPPQAKELEEAVLGAIMLEKSAFDTAIEILKPECFYGEANQRIFKAMKSLADKGLPIDLLTVVEELRFCGELDLVGGPYYVSKLTNAVVSSANIDAHARIVLQKFISREIIRISGELINYAYEDSTDVFDLLDTAEEKILQIGTNHIHGGMMDMATVLKMAINKIEEWRMNDSALTGVPSGFTKLDIATRGWQDGDLIILAARTSIGKTAFALNLARNAAFNTENPVTVAIWSLEMKAVFLMLRILSAESEIYLHYLQTGSIDDEQMKHLMKSANKLIQGKVFFDENSNIKLRTLKAKCRKLKKKNNLKLIIIDYLQLMTNEDEKNGYREQEVAKISRGLKNLAMELGIPIIALSQLSRDAAKSITWDKGPGLSGLRESGAIEQDADVVMMLWGPSNEEISSNPQLDGKRRVKIEKQRNGMLVTIDLDFKNEIQLFEAIEEQVSKPFRPQQNVSAPIDFYEMKTGSRFSSDEQEKLPF